MTTPERKLIHLATGMPEQMAYSPDKEMRTGICKKQVDETFLAKEGFQGDGVANLKYHGGPDRAVCVYPYEHYKKWNEEFDTELPMSAFGENLVVAGMLEKEVCIGDVYQVGDAVIQVTQGRNPCDTITKRTGVKGILKRMIETSYTGYLCRVLKEGTITQDAEVKLIEAHPNQVSVWFTLDLYFHHSKDVEGMQRALEVAELAEDWEYKFQTRIEKALSVAQR
jgi:MOSC domain-containing protein YiiM